MIFPVIGCLLFALSIFGNLCLLGKEGNVGWVFVEMLGKTRFEHQIIYVFGIFCSSFLIRDLTTTATTNVKNMVNNTNREGGDLFDDVGGLSMQGVVLCGLLTGLCTGVINGCIISTHLLNGAIGKQSWRSLTIVLFVLAGAMSVPYVPDYVLQIVQGNGKEPMLADLFPGVALPSIHVIFVGTVFLAHTVVRMGKKRTVLSLLNNTGQTSSSFMSIGSMRNMSKYSIVFFMGLLHGTGYSMIGLASPVRVQSALCGQDQDSVLKLVWPLSVVGVATFLIYYKLKESKHLPLYLMLSDEEKVGLDYDEKRTMSLEEQRKKISVQSLLTYRDKGSSSNGDVVVDGVFALLLGMVYRLIGYSDITSAIVGMSVHRSEKMIMLMSAIMIGLAASTLATRRR